MQINSMTNSPLYVGDHGHLYNENHLGPREPDDPQQALLEQVRRLREDLDRLVASDATARLGGELDATEDEITTSGAASPARLARLQNALTVVGSVIGNLTSAVALGKAVRALLGG